MVAVSQHQHEQAFWLREQLIRDTTEILNMGLSALQLKYAELLTDPGGGSVPLFFEPLIFGVAQLLTE